MRLALHALIRPWVARDLVSVLWAFRRRRWYRTAPFLPLPPADYLRWRMYTAYGDSGAVPPMTDVVRFAAWRRRLLKP
ncbi:MAG TPA: hypothetical protein VD793_00980 [Gemmatimonadales bacterium]|nr:hypothetical protein [Gemmatimonadales bacterium]